MMNMLFKETMMMMMIMMMSIEYVDINVMMMTKDCEKKVALLAKHGSHMRHPRSKAYLHHH